MILKQNIKRIREEINEILIRTGREDEDVTLVAVTKTVDVDTINEAIDFGITDIGENRVQELTKKIDLIGDRVNYHLIGHLQTNKVKYIIDKVKLIHSLDRISLAKELDKRAKQNDLIINTLVQVNVAEEDTKFGLEVSQVLPFIEQVLAYDNIRIRGLMTMAPYTDDEVLLRKVFRTMYELKEKILSQDYENLSMDYLSMGMTNDYKIALEEGSNMIRVGSGIFGERN
ncbi:MAG: YggS family pyridoxal phosphate-dependent enzyme [Tissierellaceae bacterium]|nr:YggS family pyridoxal phosphate-dependent enzyme [Tissierellia bacterium]